jgi:transcriptional regulator with GAF, ATPase, and Fis domain
MSSFDLKDISERLTAARDTEAVVHEFLGYLQAVRSDWRASLAFYEVSRDALVSVYERHGGRLARRGLNLSVDQLPPRLVRKFFHPSAFFNVANRRSLLTQMFQSSPYYEPDFTEAAALSPVTPMPAWQSCVCMPLADREELIAMLVIASDKKAAFGSRTIGELIPLKSLAAMALSQHLYRDAKPGDTDERAARAAAAEFQERIRRLNLQTAELAEDNRTKNEKLQSLALELEQLDRSSGEYKDELERVKGQLGALEEQSAAATQHLAEAYSQLTETQNRLAGHQATIDFLKEVFEVLAQDHDPDDFSRTMVSWFCEQFGVDRCSLMVLDSSGETLRMQAQQGIDPAIAGNVRVRLGQGISGWVAHNRKPLLVRMRGEAETVQHTFQDAYNSDSFVCVPLVHGNRLSGVLNLSNKRDGEPFDDIDLDRALLAGSVLAMTLGGQAQLRRAAAWA